MIKMKLPSDYYPCNCLKLQECRDQANTCIKFDGEHTSFSITYFHLHHEVHKHIHFCPFCGGRPRQGRHEKQASKPLMRKDKLQLAILTQQIKSLQDAYEILGQPDCTFYHWRYENPSENAKFIVIEKQTTENGESKREFGVMISSKKLVPIPKA
ncbi:MAG: hypothetical protein KA099_01435 [Alphaproteobacteria bacterium]|nr:hypothetical protein [Alphaproteobacteria bacterium]MBP7758673.1 hypothetical protein [Alphaproteobacteria bacterium]MBP7761701.1 hypothetical protein [Alphaproteobacteria bacterium]MBP7903964.1 hypothetical protein [Alphaproteobacteria bacterium]